MQTATVLATEQDTFWADIARLAGILSGEHFPTGDRAALKRMAPGQPPPLAFYRLAIRELPDNWERHSGAWQTLVTGMALLSGQLNPHSRQHPLGRALAELRYSEARLERLLAAEDDTLHTLLLRTARFLAAHKQAVDWTDCARLLLATDDSKHQHIRREIASDYYRNLKENKE